MSFRNTLFAGLCVTLSATMAHAVTIVGYDILNASPQATLSQRFDYTGTTTPSAAGVPGTVDLLGGTGSLTDGIIPTSTTGLNPFSNDSSPNASITLFFDSFVRVGTIELFGLENAGNAFGGALTGLLVTIGDFSANFSTIGFGLENRVGRLVHDRVDLEGTLFSQLETDRVTLSGFTTDQVFFGDTFTLGEIVVTESTSEVAPVPLPASGLLMIAGIAGIGALRRRKSA